MSHVFLYGENVPNQNMSKYITIFLKNLFLRHVFFYDRKSNRILVIPFVYKSCQIVSEMRFIREIKIGQRDFKIFSGWTKRFKSSKGLDWQPWSDY